MHFPTEMFQCRVRLYPRLLFSPPISPISVPNLHLRSIMTSSIDAARAKIAEEVSIDILSKTQDAENAVHIKAISRTFICELDVRRIHQ